MGNQMSLSGTDNATLTGPPVSGTEFENFENLTRKLVQVPKSEIDEQRHADPS